MTTQTLPAAAFRVVAAVAVLNSDGSVKDYVTQIMAGGTVTIDATAENLRTCSFQCLDPDGVLTPIGTAGQLNPDGVEIKIFVGYMVDDVVTMFSQGIFRITQVDIASGSGSTAPGPVLTVQGTDRSLRISTNLFENAYNIPDGTNVATAILDILGQQAPWCTQTSIASTTATVAAQAYQPGDDPWQAIQEVCASAGMIAYFDREGVFRVINNPSSNPTTPTALFKDGPDGTAVSVSRTVSNSPGYNGVIVTGQSLGSSSSTVISGSYFDSDPNSPTYYLGAYGKVPAPPVMASTVTSAAQAQSMAQAILPQVLGLTRQVVVDTVPCYWLEAFDLVYIVDAATQTKEVDIVEQATIPMDYSQLESITGVPLGTPVSQFDGLANQPSIAAYAPTSTGAFSYNSSTGTYSYGSSSGAGGFGLLGTGGLGGFGGGGLGIYSVWGAGNMSSYVLRTGRHGYGVNTGADAVDTVDNVAEDL